MSGPALIALASAVTSVTGLAGTLIVAWPRTVKARSLAVRHRHAESFVDQLWARGEHQSALKLLMWLQNTEHPPPELVPQRLEAVGQTRNRRSTTL